MWRAGCRLGQAAGQTPPPPARGGHPQTWEEGTRLSFQKSLSKCNVCNFIQPRPQDAVLAPIRQCWGHSTKWGPGEPPGPTIRAPPQNGPTSPVCRQYEGWSCPQPWVGRPGPSPWPSSLPPAQFIRCQPFANHQIQTLSPQAWHDPLPKSKKRRQQGGG